MLPKLALNLHSSGPSLSCTGNTDLHHPDGSVSSLHKLLQSNNVPSCLQAFWKWGVSPSCRVFVWDFVFLKLTWKCCGDAEDGNILAEAVHVLRQDEGDQKVGHICFSGLGSGLWSWKIRRYDECRGKASIHLCISRVTYYLLRNFYVPDAVLGMGSD